MNQKTDNAVQPDPFRTLVLRTLTTFAGTDAKLTDCTDDICIAHAKFWHGESCERELLEEAGKLAVARNEVIYLKKCVGTLREALGEIHAEGVGALNNAFPGDAPEIVESMAQKAEVALKTHSVQRPYLSPRDNHHLKCVP